MNFCWSTSFFYLIPAGLISDASMSHFLRSGYSLSLCIYRDRKMIFICENISEKNSIASYSTIHASLYFFRRNIENIHPEYTRVPPSVLMNDVIFFRCIYRGVYETPLECRTHSEGISVLEKRPPHFHIFYLTWLCLYREHHLSDPGISSRNQGYRVHGDESIDILTPGTPLFGQYLCDVLVESPIILSIFLALYSDFFVRVYSFELESCGI